MKSQIINYLMVLSVLIGIDSSVLAGTNGEVTSVQSLHMTPQELKIKTDFELKMSSATRKVVVQSVQKTPWPNLFELVLEDNTILYTDAKTSYTMAGALINNSDGSNLTQRKTNELLKVDPSSLPDTQAFISVRGKGERKIYLFEDPNCGYCKKFRHELVGIDNLTIQTYVISILGDDSKRKSLQVLCSPDIARAWEDWMVNDKPPEDNPNCDMEQAQRRLQANSDLAVKLKVDGTPTIILSEGSRLPGMVERAELEKLLIQ